MIEGGSASSYGDTAGDGRSPAFGRVPAEWAILTRYVHALQDPRVGQMPSSSEDEEDDDEEDAPRKDKPPPAQAAEAQPVVYKRYPTCLNTSWLALHFRMQFSGASDIGAHSSMQMRMCNVQCLYAG